MSTRRLTLSLAHLDQAQDERGKPIGSILIEDGTLAPRVLAGALAESGRVAQPIARVLEAEALASPDDILSAQALHHGALALRRETTAPDASLAAALPADFCLQHGVLPWLRIGETVVLATSRPDRFDDVLTLLPGDLGPVTMGLAREADIHTEIALRHGEALAARAETQLALEDSCRDINQANPVARRIGLGLLALCAAALVYAPAMLFTVALCVTLCSLIASQLLKLSALIASRNRTLPSGPAHLPKRPPVVTILVPLLKEHDIADTLVARLTRLTYPKTLLDIVLVLEAEDDQTQEMLRRTRLPAWMRVIEVPPGSVMTKPRALNYALRFARGDIIGIYDAEDAPAPDQIDRVVEQFARAPAHVACLQGILDFYNPRANWLSRCFAIEYAGWFRVMLPGLSRLGFAVPLGGTTLFFRRDVLEDLQGWDAHNVTEDADLGIRLARRGYTTELIPTVTREEANNRFWPWIKQRSRWLKGYAITWWVHSRRPLRLWRDLGAWKFVGMQLLFLTTLVQFTLAPVLWSFWLILLGLPHPLDGVLSPEMTFILTGVFLGAEAIGLLIYVIAVTRSPHGFLIPWVPTLFAYFILGTFAIYRGLYEIARNPFYWDKTEHGHSAPDNLGADLIPQDKA